MAVSVFMCLRTKFSRTLEIYNVFIVKSPGFLVRAVGRKRVYIRHDRLNPLGEVAGRLGWKIFLGKGKKQ
jgi:hypothetical protein